MTIIVLLVVVVFCLFHNFLFAPLLLFLLMLLLLPNLDILDGKRVLNDTGGLFLDDRVKQAAWKKSTITAFHTYSRVPDSRIYRNRWKIVENLIVEHMFYTISIARNNRTPVIFPCVWLLGTPE